MVEIQQPCDSNDTQLLVVNAAEGVHVAKPQAEEPVCPALGLEDLKGEKRVVVDGIDNHLHQVNSGGLDFDVLGGEDVHRHGDEALNTLVNVTLQAQHHSLGKFASAYPLKSLNIIVKHTANHRIQGVDVVGGLDQLRGTILNNVVESGEHILQIVLGTSFKCYVNQLERLPHVGGNALGCKGAAVDDLENFVIQVYEGQ